jgi:transcriptional regulator with XRE-family HTH domain
MSKSLLSSDVIGNYTQAELKSFVCGRLVEIQEKMGLKTAKLAEMLGVPHITFREYVLGNRMPPLMVLIRLNVLMGVDLNTFMPGDLVKANR